MADNEVKLVISTDASGTITNLQRVRGEVKNLEDQTTSSAGIMSDAFSRIAVAAAGAFAISGIFEFVASTLNAKEQLVKLSQEVGVSASSLQLYQYAARASGVDTDKVTTAMGFLAKNMMGAIDGTGKAAGAFSALGISVKDAAGNLKPTDEVMSEISDKFAGMQDGAGKTALAMLMFGRSGKEMIPILDEGSQHMAALRQEAEALGMSFDENAIKAAARTHEEFEKLWMVFGNIGGQLVNTMLPALDELAKGLGDAAKSSNGFEGLKKAFVEILQTAYGLSMELDKIGGTMTALMVYRAKVGELNPLSASSRAGYGESEQYWREQNKMFQDRYTASQTALEGFTARSMGGGAQLTPGAQAALSGLAGGGGGKSPAPLIDSGKMQGVLDSFDKWKRQVADLDPMLSATAKQLEKLDEQAADFANKGIPQTQIDALMQTAKGYLTERDAIEQVKKEITATEEAEKRRQTQANEYESLYKQYGNIRINENQSALAKIDADENQALGKLYTLYADDAVKYQEFEDLKTKITQDAEDKRANLVAHYALQLAQNRAAESATYYQGRAALSIGTPAENIGGELAAKQAEIDAIKSIQQTPGLSDTAITTYQKQVDQLIKALVPLQVKMVEIGGTFAEGLEGGLRKLAYSSQSNYQQGVVFATDAAKGAHDTMQSIFFDAMSGQWQGATHYALQFVQSLEKALSDLLSKQLMQQILGLGSSSGGSGSGIFGMLGSLLGSLFTEGTQAVPGIAGGLPTSAPYVPGIPEAHGDAFYHGEIAPFARGGIFGRPTLFPMARGYGLMGEAGAEAVMPLARTASGHLGVRAGGMGDGGTSNTFIIQAMDSKSFLDFCNRNPGAIIKQVDRNLKDNGALRQTLQRTR